MPFTFEGKRRIQQAEQSLSQLQKRADALILFENNRMGELTLPKDGIQKAFTQADQLIAQSLRAVSTILTTPGLVKLGLDDLTAALSTSNGRCLFGFGEARGQNRGTEALKRALKSPLIDQGRLLHQTKTLLVHIAGGESLTLLEVDAVMKQLGKNVPDQTHILFGVAVDAKLGDSVCVTLLSSLGLAQLNTLAAAAPPVEMMPHKERSMPSIMEAVTPAPKAAAPKPARNESVKSAPLAEDMDMLFRTEEITPPAPRAPEPETVQEEVYEEVYEEVAVIEAPAAIEEQIPDEIIIEEPVAASLPEPEPEPVKPARPRIEDFIRQTVVRPSTTSNTLASVVARNPSPAVEEAPLIPATRSNGKTSEEEAQIAFRFGSEEDRGRFQKTEPVLADGGEDLDVPTWMRLKRKLKR
jgi:cell division protein FtsZ